MAMARLIDGTTERSSTAQNLPCRRRSTKARVCLVSDLSVRSPPWSNVPMNESSMTWLITDGLQSSSCLRRRSIFKTSNPQSKRWGYAQSQPEKLRWGQTWFSVFKCYNFAQLHSAVFQLESVLARKPRVKFPGAIYHVVTRGDGRQLLFHDDRHYQRFTEGLEAEVLREASLGSDLVFGFQML